MFVVAVSKNDLDEWCRPDSSNDIKCAALLSWALEFEAVPDYPVFVANSIEECKQHVDGFNNSNEDPNDVTRYVMFKVEEILA